MLSRLALPLRNRTVITFPQRNHQLQWSATTVTDVAKPTTSTVPAESDGVRDLVNFPRPVQAKFGGKVRLAFIPDEWFQFFYKKTGVTGPYLFFGGLVTFLCSKEWFIMEHEYYTGVSLAILFTIIIKKFGPMTEEYCEREMEEECKELREIKDSRVRFNAESIELEKTEQWRTEAQPMIFEAKRENVALQLEAEYRKRAFQVYQDVKKRLDYHVETINITRQVHHKHMVNWIIDNAVKSITPQQEEEALKKCINDLKSLSAAH